MSALTPARKGRGFFFAFFSLRGGVPDVFCATNEQGTNCSSNPHKIAPTNERRFAMKSRKPVWSIEDAKYAWYWLRHIHTTKQRPIRLHGQYTFENGTTYDCVTLATICAYFGFNLQSPTLTPDTGE